MTYEIIKIVIQAIVPLLLFVFGILILRKTESIKTQIERQSHFTKRWADLFFETCHEFMNSVERVMALLNSIQQLEDPNNERGTRYQNECSDLFPKIAELELKIRRMIFFAPQSGQSVRENASAIFNTLGDMIRNRQGNLDELYCHIANFNRAVHKAHDEMLSRSGKARGEK